MSGQLVVIWCIEVTGCRGEKSRPNRGRGTIWPGAYDVPAAYAVSAAKRERRRAEKIA